jgi:DNA-binding transcriptional MerR regulator
MGHVIELPDTVTLPPHHASTTVTQALTGATQRQVDYWIRKGLVGRHLKGLGSGANRAFTPADVEVVWALTQLAALGCSGERLEAAIEPVRLARVKPDGERLVVPLRGPAYRHPLDTPTAIRAAAWMIPLRAFTEADQHAAAEALA